MKTAAKKKQKAPIKPKLNIVLPRPKAVAVFGPRHYLQHAGEYPILGCWRYAGWEEKGIGPMVVARDQGENKVIFGVFLVDWYCLGVKNAFCNADFSHKKFEQSLPKFCSHSPEPCDVEFAHEYVYGAIEFARQYGFEPHADYKLASLVLDPPEAHPRSHNLQFGKDGQPFYISGPYESPAQAQRIVKTLQRTAGEGNYNYIMGLGGFDDFGNDFAFEDDDDDDDGDNQFSLGQGSGPGGGFVEGKFK